jgi:hypothetical protein
MDLTRRDAAAALGAVLAAGLVFRTSDAEADCPNIIKAVNSVTAALKDLQAAQADLKAAKHDFGGHRADALAAIDSAIGPNGGGGSMGAAIKQLGLCLTCPQCK